MQNFLGNNKRLAALMIILVLAVGSISIVGTSHLTMASQIGKLCIIFACGNANITGGTSSGGGGGQPIPTTGTLTVFKKVLQCSPGIACQPKDFAITVTGNNPSPASFPGSETGTKVTIGPGKYTVSESTNLGVIPSFSGDCDQNPGEISASGNINVGETQECTITNLVS